ncbi:MAG: enoyl-CoA hydratase [Actinomycetota bacterium]|nr:enoyl-CoA hydratase [Actinomycetota bacterium]
MWPFLQTETEHVAVRAELLDARSGVALRTWAPSEAVAYAAGVGATPEEGPPATLVTLLAQFGVEFPAGLGPWAFARVLHAEQSHTTYAPVPLRGRLSIRTRVSDLRDLPSGVIVAISAEAVDGDDGTLVASTRMGLFVRGEHCGIVGASGPVELPERPADQTVVHHTRADQAERYARCGDDNPLHLDDSAARASGQPRPVLHGLCTYGFAGRALVSVLCPGRPEQLAAMSARFTATVLPGDTLRTDVWRSADGAVFRTSTARGPAVTGTARLR